MLNRGLEVRSGEPKFVKKILSYERYPEGFVDKFTSIAKGEYNLAEDSFNQALEYLEFLRNLTRDTKLIKILMAVTIYPDSPYYLIWNCYNLFFRIIISI